MSTLKVIERAALTLSREEQRQLLVFLTAMIGGGPASSSGAPSQAAKPDAVSLHPNLLSVIGIIPAGADVTEIHEYRLLKHL